MDEQNMDVVEHGEPIDLDAPEAMPGSDQARRRQQVEAARERVAARLDGVQRQAAQLPLRVFTGAVGVLPVQTREHLRQSARESVLAVTSLVNAAESATLLAVDRLFADPRSAKETAQPRRIIIEREDGGEINPS